MYFVRIAPFFDYFVIGCWWGRYPRNRGIERVGGEHWCVDWVRVSIKFRIIFIFI